MVLQLISQIQDIHRFSNLSEFVLSPLKREYGNENKDIWDTESQSAANFVDFWRKANQNFEHIRISFRNFFAVVRRIGIRLWY